MLRVPKSSILSEKKEFQTRMEAIDWIAAYAKNEGQFEVMREQLTFNFIYTRTLFIKIDSDSEYGKVVILKNE